MSKPTTFCRPAEAATAARGDHAGRGARVERLDGDALGVVGRHRAAAVVHDEHDVGLEAGLGERLLERVHVAAQDGRAVGVRDRRRRALELRRLGQDVGRERDVQARQLLEQDLARPPLVRRVHVRVDEADRDRLDLARPQLARRTARTESSSSGVDHVARVVDALVDLEPVPARDERRRRVPQDVVELGAVGAADLEHVAEAARRDERRVRAVARDDGVRRHGRAVEERRDLGRLDAERAHALDDAEVEARRRRRHLRRRATRPSR